MTDRRRKSSRGRRGAEQAVRELAASYRCPDCDSRTELTEIAPGIYDLTIRHDNTCPVFKEMTS